MFRQFRITCKLARGQTVTGIRTWTGSGTVDPKEYYSYKARKAYGKQLVGLTVSELLLAGAEE